MWYSQCRVTQRAVRVSYYKIVFNGSKALSSCGSVRYCSVALCFGFVRFSKG